VGGDVRRVPEPDYEHVDCAPVEREAGYAAHQVRERVALLAAALRALRLPEYLRVPARGAQQLVWPARPLNEPYVDVSDSTRRQRSKGVPEDTVLTPS
jgi:hypothetical protein